MYAVHCLNHSHELYDMQTDPVQMVNLHPTAPAEHNQKNAFHKGQTELAGFEIPRLLNRTDALLMVLKSCKGSACTKPWHELHKNGEVKNLRDAMDKQFDAKYAGISRVRFNECFKTGKVDINAEGPQWNGTSGGRDETPSTGADDACPDDVVGQEEYRPTAETWEGLDEYWDDWE